MKRVPVPFLLAFLLNSGLSLAAEGKGLEESWCRFLLAEEHRERDDLEVELDLARSESAAAEKIYGMVERLWKEEAIERMVFLLARHESETTRLEVERRRLRLERQEAIIEQYEHFCAALAERGVSSEHRERLEAAFDRYRAAQCGVIDKDVAIAAADVAYLREFLQSVLELRQGDVATMQDVIRAERDVEMASKRLEQGRRRALACREEP